LPHYLTHWTVLKSRKFVMFGNGYYNQCHAGTFIDQYGYERFSDSGKSVSRWAAEKKLGRALRAGEVVHHMDRNKLNNCPENLWVFRNQYEHSRVHEYDTRRFGPGYSYGGRRRYFRDDYY